MTTLDVMFVKTVLIYWLKIIYKIIKNVQCVEVVGIILPYISNVNNINKYEICIK